MKILLFCLFFSVSLAQNLTGTYTMSDPSGSSMTLKLIENPDKTLNGNLIFGDATVVLTGNNTGPGMASAFLQDEDTGNAFGFTLHLVEPQITLKANDTGDEIILSRESAEVPTLVQVTTGVQTEGTLANDPKLEECLKFLEDEQAASDPQKVEGCQTYINSVLGSSTGDLSEEDFDPEELAYCREFLADATAVAEDPDEVTYCQDYINTYGNQNNGNQNDTNQPSSPEPSEEAQSNPLDTSATISDPFSGTFRGNDIALTLQGNGQYTGTLEFKGQSYPVQASSQGNILTGTFESNSSSFEFSATLQDTTLTLESAGQSYPMLKDPTSQ